MGTNTHSQKIAPINLSNGINLSQSATGPGDILPLDGVVSLENKTQDGIVILPLAHIITFATTAPVGNLTITGEDVRGKVISEQLVLQLTFQTELHFQVIREIVVDGSATTIEVGTSGLCSTKFFHNNPKNFNDSYNPGLFLIPDVVGDFVFTVFSTPTNVNDKDIDLGSIGEYPHPNFTDSNVNDPIGDLVQSYDNKALFHRLVVTTFTSGQATYRYVF